jgi:putative transposase
MKKTRHTLEQIIRMLRQAEVKLAAGSSVAQVARELGHLPPLEGSLRRHEPTRGQTPQGVGERERPPEEAPCRKGAGHRHAKGGESGKLLSPSRRRKAVKHLQKNFRVSERRACRVVDQPRSSQRYLSTKADKDAALTQMIVALSGQNPRYGYRRVWALLRREGWEVNKKRVHRLWREADLKVPAGRRRKRQRLGSSENGVARRRAEYLGHLWSYDFAMDATEDGRRLKMMPVVDEYSRECLALEVERSITSEEVVKTLDRLFAERGAPRFIRSDNGPEFIAQAVKRWLAASGVETLYIEPGAPWENAYSETFISRMRDELLDREEFANLKEAKVLAEDYRDHYNHHRPHGALGCLTPVEFAAIEALADQGSGPSEQLESVQRLSL